MCEQQAKALYVRELSAAIFLYAVVLIGAITVGQKMPEGRWRTMIMVSPMLPFMLALCAVIRQVRRSDEFIRLSTLQNITIAAAVTAGWTFTYGFLENAGFPRISMFTVWPVMGAVWGAVGCLGNLRNR